jgi:hypothetical protein
MNGVIFTNLMESAFRPFLGKLGFAMQPLHVSGRYYRATFGGPHYTLLITFEPGDENTTVMLLTNGDDDLKAIDDPARTPRLADLNSRYMPQVSTDARSENEAYFDQFAASDRTEKLLLKCAKDLRLVLPLHLAT